MNKAQQQSLVIELGKKLAESTVNEYQNVDDELAKEYLNEYRILKSWARTRLHLPET